MKNAREVIQRQGSRVTGGQTEGSSWPACAIFQPVLIWWIWYVSTLPGFCSRDGCRIGPAVHFNSEKGAASSLFNLFDKTFNTNNLSFVFLEEVDVLAVETVRD